MSSIYFFEDNYCQLEILPIENFEFCLKQAGLLREFADAHRDGLGYTDVFMLNDSPVSMYDKKIPVHILEKMLSSILPKFDEVVCIDYYPHKKSKYINAFGKNKNVVVFYDIKDNFVDNIWLTLDIGAENDIIVAKDMFSNLAKLGEFIVADWGWDFVENINNTEEIADYLQKRLEVFAKTGNEQVKPSAHITKSSTISQLALFFSRWRKKRRTN